MTTTHPSETDRPARPVAGLAWIVWSTALVAVGITASTLYALLADDPYRDLPEATLVAARAQDVCSVLVAGLLVFLARRTSPRVHVVRLGLMAYVAYSYAVYLIGVPMNRIFLVYVVIVSLSGAVLLDGLVRLRPSGWPRTNHRRLERGTGWLLVVIAALFGTMWLSALLPFALGGPTPSPAGPGGVAYPIFVLDLVVVLAFIAAVGILLRRGRAVAGPLVLVALVKIITLFTALWVGVLVGLVEGADVHLASDAVPSLLMLAVCSVLVGRWSRALTPDPRRFCRPGFWAD